MSKNLLKTLWCNFLVWFTWKFISHRHNSHHTPCIFAKPMHMCKYVEPLTWTHPFSMVKRTYHEDVFSHISTELIISHENRDIVSTWFGVFRRNHSTWIIALDMPRLCHTSLTWTCHKPKLILPSNFSTLNLIALENFDIVSTPQKGNYFLMWRVRQSRNHRAY